MVGLGLHVRGAVAKLHEQVSEHGRGVFRCVFVGATLVHRLGAVEQGLDVDAGHGRGEEAHRREHAEPPAHALGDWERGNACLVADGAHGPLFGVGDRHDMVGPAAADAVLEHLTDDHELRGGLGGLTRFGDHIEECLLGIADPKHAGEVRWVHIVHDKDPRPGALGAGQQVVGGLIECGLDGDVAQCRATDAEDDQVLEPPLAFVGDGLHLIEVGVAHGVVPELTPPLPAGAPRSIERARQIAESLGVGGNRVVRQPVGADA